jgi:2'-5' RNA ligase
MMEDFFATVTDRWPAGREDFHWHVLPGPAAARECLSRQYQEVTSAPGLAPVPGVWMHITVQHVAPVTEVSTSEIKQITALVRDACAQIAPFAVTACRAEAWPTALVCPIRPGAPLRHLWQVTTSAAARVTGGRISTVPGVYHPHLSLAYAHDHVEHEPVKAWLSDATASEVALPVTRLVLVAQQHDRRHITWRLVDEIPLTEPRPAERTASPPDRTTATA